MFQGLIRRLPSRHLTALRNHAPEFAERFQGVGRGAGMGYVSVAQRRTRRRAIYGSVSTSDEDLRNTRCNLKSAAV